MQNLPLEMERLLYQTSLVNNEDQVRQIQYDLITSKQKHLDSGKPGPKGLCVLGYDNVKSTPINPKMRQELEYIDREV